MDYIRNECSINWLLLFNIIIIITIIILIIIIVVVVNIIIIIIIIIINIIIIITIPQFCQSYKDCCVLPLLNEVNLFNIVTFCQSFHPAGNTVSKPGVQAKLHLLWCKRSELKRKLSELLSRNVPRVT